MTSTLPGTLGYYKAREAEYRAALRKWILERDAYYRKMEAEYAAKLAKPLRHPRGEDHERHTRRYWWTDAIWCQDVYTDVFEEMFEVDVCDDFEADTEHPVVAWAMQVFGEEFQALLPDLADVWEG